jgi:hypothetical protein
MAGGKAFNKPVVCSSIDVIVNDVATGTGCRTKRGPQRKSPAETAPPPQAGRHSRRVITHYHRGERLN